MAQTDVLFSGLISATANGDSLAMTDTIGRLGKLDFSTYTTLAVWVQQKTFSGGTSPTIQVIIASGDGQVTPYYANLNGDAPTWNNGGNNYRTSIGPGTSHNDSLGTLGKILWNISGSPAACTFYVHIEGKRG